VIDRRDFLFKLGAAGVAPAALGAAPTPAPERRTDFLSHALVLSGGGARGAYEAGIIWEMARRAGLRDGERFTPYEFVCGASIGALNGWFVATGQYSMLENLWRTIAQANLVRLKPEFEKITVQTAGLTNRLLAAFRLLGLTKDQKAVAQSDPVITWMKHVIDPRTPLIVPLVWSVTDLVSQQPEYFYRLPPGFPGPPAFITESLQITVGPHVVIREATDAVLHRALLGSAALPLVFDPVAIPDKNGRIRQYVDGGVASNSPVSIARTVAKGVDVILLDPREEFDDLPSAIDVSLAAFRTMQRKILESEFAQAYVQSFAKLELERIVPDALERLSAESPLFNTFLKYVPISELRYMRPKETLPVGVGAFDDQENIDKTFAIGATDAGAGFTDYDWETFRY